MGVECRARFEDHSVLRLLAACQPVFVRPIILVFALFGFKMSDSKDSIVGLTICGEYQIIFRPGRFFLFFFLCEFFICSRYNSGCLICRFGDPGEGNNPLARGRGTTVEGEEEEDRHE